MKITKDIIKDFEQTQKDCGTAVAIYNIIWLVADSLLKDLGIKNVKTSNKVKKVK